MRLRYITGQDGAVARFVAQLIPHCDRRGFPKGVEAIGVLDDGQLVAGLVYYWHNPVSGTIEMAAAALRGRYWLSRAIVERAFNHAFGRRGCQMVIMRVRADNGPLLKRLAAFGFDRYHIPRLYGRNADGVICTLTIDQWAVHPLNRHRAQRQQEAA